MATRICRRAFIVSLCGVSTWPLLAARAQTYPSRPITMVVPFAAGGGLDVLGRILAARMSEILGHQVIIENATGAAGIVGVKRVVNAAPDGYTFLLGTIGTHAYNQTIYRKLRYDAVADFTPVALFAEQPMVLTARKDFPADNFTQFIAYLKTNSAKLQFGSAGVGTMTYVGCALRYVGLEAGQGPARRTGGMMAHILVMECRLVAHGVISLRREVGRYQRTADLSGEPSDQFVGSQQGKTCCRLLL